MIDIERISNVLYKAPRPPEQPLPAGCSKKDIQDFEADRKIDLPEDTRIWLRMCNGVCAGPGGLFGLNTREQYLDMGYHLDLYPDWEMRRWIPIAGDGCGNYYLQASLQEFGDGFPIFFVETHDNPSVPGWIVASDLSHFLIFLLEKELGASGWPFDAATVLRDDPELAAFHGIRLPWDA